MSGIILPLVGIVTQAALIVLEMLITCFNILLIALFTFLQDDFRVVVWLVKFMLGQTVFEGSFLWRDLFITFFWAVMAPVYLFYVISPAIEFVLTTRPSPKYFSPSRKIGFKVVCTYCALLALFTLFNAARSFVDGLIG